MVLNYTNNGTERGRSFSIQCTFRQVNISEIPGTVTFQTDMYIDPDTSDCSGTRLFPIALQKESWEAPPYNQEHEWVARAPEQSGALATLVASVTASVSVFEPSTPSSGGGGDDNKKKLTLGLAIGIPAGIIALVAVVLLCRRCKKAEADTGVLPRDQQYNSFA
jgi:hypothetical protein